MRVHNYIGTVTFVSIRMLCVLQCIMCGLCCGPGVFTSECVGENNSECAVVVDCMKVRWFKQTEQNESF